MGEIFRLKNTIQNYAWGSRTTLGVMRSVPTPTDEPEAEVWVGAHSAAPSIATVDGVEAPLDELVRANPGRFLPAGVDSFPFLFKILAIDAPLSIQVHPTDEQAVAGYAAEQAAGIPLDAPHRNYKDEHSKPETVIALTTMRVLTGVRPLTELLELAAAFGADWLSELLGAEAEFSPKNLLTEIIRMPGERAAEAVRQLVDAAGTLRGARLTDGASPENTVSETVRNAADLVELIHNKYPADRGLLVAFVMNLLHLSPGDAAHTPDGQVHAYVSGTAIELMNPSDNVMRAGLTPKYIDTEELIRVLGDTQDAPVITRPEPDNAVPGRAARGTYGMWDERMSVERIRVVDGKGIDYVFEGTSATLVTEGEITVTSPRGSFTLGGTESVLHVGDPTPASITGTGSVYIARYR